MEMAAAAVKSVPGFGCRFARTDWFGEDVLSLAPEPAGPFRALTAAVHAAFPQYPPFGGAFADVIPHLTVGDRPEGGISALRAAQAQLPMLPMLPVRTHVSCAWLMTGTRAPGSWQRLAAFPLGQQLPAAHEYARSGLQTRKLVFSNDAMAALYPSLSGPGTDRLANVAD